MEAHLASHVGAEEGITLTARPGKVDEQLKSRLDLQTRTTNYHRSMQNKRQQPIPGRIPDTPDDAPTTTTYLVDEESSTGLKLAPPTPLCQNNKATNHQTQKAGFQKRFAGA